MKLKTYRAPSMAQALTAVKKDLGKDAVILHTRSVKVGGVLGFRRKTVIEITASDEPVKTGRRPARAPVEPPPAPPAPAAPAMAAVSAYRKVAEAGGVGGARTGGTPRGAEAAAPAGPAPMASASAIFAASAPATPASAAAPRAGVAQSGISSLRSEIPPAPPEPTVMQVRPRRAGAPAGAPLPPAPAPSVRPTLAPFAPVDDAAAATIHRELADIKLLVNQVLHSSPASSAGVAAGAMPEALFKHYLRLLESAVARDIADAVIGAVRDELTPGELHDEAIVRQTVLRHLAGLIPVADSVVTSKAGGREGGPLVIALVGPTGVGKTTTIAKLAAAYKLRHARSVALITSDTYRIAAVDQLRTYAGIIGLTLKVVMTPAEMAAAVESLRNHDVILIDTAGRSQFNADRLDELRAFLAAADPTEVHLVLSTTAAEPVLVKTAEAFASLRPSRVILTKLDEAVNFGVILNVARRLRTALSFVTTGQEVPDDIEPGQPDRLARMVLDNAVAPRGRGVAGVGAAAGSARESALVGGAA